MWGVIILFVALYILLSMEWIEEKKMRNSPIPYIVVDNSSKEFNYTVFDDYGCNNFTMYSTKIESHNSSYIDCWITKFRGGIFNDLFTNEICVKKTNDLSCDELRISTRNGYRFDSVCTEDVVSIYPDSKCILFIVSSTYGTYTKKVCRNIPFIYGKIYTNQCMIYEYTNNVVNGFVCWTTPNSYQYNIYCGYYHSPLGIF